VAGSVVTEMLYKALGYVVWQAGKWYARRKLPPRGLLVGGALTLGAATLVAAGARHEAD
jgi:hypothetical protein